MRQPVPLPPDSIRSNYGFSSDELWHDCLRRYHADIRRRHDGEFLASQIVFEGLAPAFLFAAAFKHLGY